MTVQGAVTSCDAVAIAFAASAEACVEAAVDVAHGRYGDIRRQQSVDTPENLFRSEAVVRMDVGDLTEGMGAGVRPPRTNGCHVVLQQPPQGPLQLPLNGAS